MNTVRWHVAALALAAFLGIMGAASAQPPRGPGKGGPPSFGTLLNAFDADGDGKLSQDEVPPRVWMRLGRADANGDGVVTKTEFDDYLGG